MKNIIGSLLIALALFLGYIGINKVSNSEESVEVIGIELSASDEDKKTTGFVYLGLAVVSLLGGISALGKKS